MLKIIAVCGNGMGTSMIIKLKVEEIIKKLGIEGTVEAISVGQASGMARTADIIVCSIHLVDQLPLETKERIASVKNLMDSNEIEEALKKIL